MGTSAQKSIRVLIVDDHLLFREGLSRILQNVPDIEIVGSAGDGTSALRAAGFVTPDVIMLDVAMPKLSGIEVLRTIKKKYPAVSVIMLSAYSRMRYVRNCLDAGASGYLLKTIPQEDLINAIRLVHRGQVIFNLEAARGLISTARTELKWQLHQRELEALRFAAKGLANKEIAARMGISEHTVGSHLIHAFRKFGVRSRTQAVLKAVREGLIDEDELDTSEEH